MYHKAKYFHFLAFIFVILFYFNSYCSISSKTSSQKLDSLLLLGKPAEALNYALQDPGISPGDREMLKQMSKSIELTGMFTAGEIEQHIKSYQALALYFEPENAGETAYYVYNKFIILCEKGENVKALKAYFIARFFKKRYLKKSISDAREILRSARSCYQKGQYAETLEIVRRSRITVSNNVEIAEIVDSLKALEKFAQKSSHTQKTWNRQQQRSIRYLLGLGMSIVYQNSISNEVLALENSIYTFDGQIKESDLKSIPIGNVKSYYRQSFSFLGNLKVKESFLFGLNFNYYVFSFNSKINNDAFYDKVFFDLKFRNYEFQLYGKYVFRNYGGLRPHVNLGAAYDYIYRQEGTAGTYDFLWHPELGTKPKIDSGTIAKKSFGNMGVYSAAGMEYIPDATSRFLIGSQVSFIRYFDEIGFAKKNHLRVTAYLGLIL